MAAVGPGPAGPAYAPPMGDPPTERTRVRRLSERAVYDREPIYRVLDEALICHVGFVHDGGPVVIPTIHARIGDVLYFHGSPASRMLRGMRAGNDICVNVTLVDGLVVARAAFHNSMNYRSVVLFGRPEIVDDPDEKRMAVAAITEHLLPGRWADSRPMTEQELRGTLVARLPIDEVSAKVRTGGPGDEEADYGLPVWAGVIPLRLEAGDPIDDPRLEVGVGVPAYLSEYRR